MRKTFRILFFFEAVLWAGAKNLTCFVTQKDELTTYRVSASEGTGCYYSWSNETDYVLANEAEKPEDPVVNKSQTSLTTKKCLETVYYKLDCTSVGTPQKSSCTVDCRGGDDGGSRNYWPAIIAALSSVLVVLVIIIIIPIITISQEKKSLNPLNLSEEEEQQGA